MTIQHLQKLIRTGVYNEDLAEIPIAAVKRALSTKLPLLLDGPAGCGKTMSVYFVANDLGIEVIEINASDNLRLKKNLALLHKLITEGHDGIRIILLDELEKSINTKNIIPLIHLNKRIAYDNNTIVIATSNNGWQLKSPKVKIEGERYPQGLLDVFAGFHIKIKAPHMRKIQKQAKFILKERKLEVRVPRDLRYLEKLYDHQGESTNNVIDRNDDSFGVFSEFMESFTKDRPDNIPTPKQLGGSLQKWLLTNCFDEKSQKKFVRKNQAEFHNIIETISLADMYGSHIFKFLPTFTMYYGFFKHPSSILRGKDI